VLDEDRATAASRGDSADWQSQVNGDAFIRIARVRAADRGFSDLH
jgi:hypothetical protein